MPEDDSLYFSDDKKELLKALGMKVLDCLVKIGPADELTKESYKAIRELSKAGKTLDGLGGGGGEIKSSDYSINKLAQLARYLQEETLKLADHDENWWLYVSGVNMLRTEQTTEALLKLRQQRRLLLDLKECCDGLKGLAMVVIGAAHFNIKSIAKLYMPSVIAIDATVTKQTIAKLDNCTKAIDRSLDKLENGIRVTADWQKWLDRCLVLLNSSDQRKVLDAIQRSQDGKTEAAGKE
jgi:hypothetical protein